MIQRIQSLYLLAVAALMLTATLTPLAYFVGGVDEYLLYAFALKGGGIEHSLSLIHISEPTRLID